MQERSAMQIWGKWQQQQRAVELECRRDEDDEKKLRLVSRNVMIGVASPFWPLY